MRNFAPAAALAGLVLLSPLSGCAPRSGEASAGPEAQKPERNEPPPEPIQASKPIVCEGHTGSSVTAAVSPDGKLVASGSADGTLRFWRAADGKLIHSVKAIDPSVRAGWVGALAFSPDGKTLAATCSRDGLESLAFYDTATGTPAPQHGPRGKAGGADASFSPDGKALAVANSDGVQVWDVVRGDKIRDFPVPLLDGHNRGGGATQARFSPEGKRLAVARMSSGFPHAREGPMLRVLDLATGNEVFGTKDGEGDGVSVLAFSPNGRFLATDDGRGRAGIYDWARKERAAAFQAHSRVLFCLAYAPDGKVLYTAGDDPDVRAWSPATAKQVYSLKGNTGPVYSIALSRNGKVMAAAGRDKRVLIWHLGVR